MQRCQDAAILEPEIQRGNSELLSSGLPWGSCQGKLRKYLAQLRTGLHLLAVETGRFGAARVQRERRLCQRYELSFVDDVEHMIFDCTGQEAERLKHQSSFARGRMVNYFE